MVWIRHSKNSLIDSVYWQDDPIWIKKEKKITEIKYSLKHKCPHHMSHKRYMHWKFKQGRIIKELEKEIAKDKQIAAEEEMVRILTR